MALNLGEGNTDRDMIDSLLLIYLLLFLRFPIPFQRTGSPPREAVRRTPYPLQMSVFPTPIMIRQRIEELEASEVNRLCRCRKRDPDWYKSV